MQVSLLFPEHRLREEGGSGTAEANIREICIAPGRRGAVHDRGRLLGAVPRHFPRARIQQALCASSEVKFPADNITIQSYKYDRQIGPMTPNFC